MFPACRGIQSALYASSHKDASRGTSSGTMSVENASDAGFCNRRTTALVHEKVFTVTLIAIASDRELIVAADEHIQR